MTRGGLSSITQWPASLIDDSRALMMFPRGAAPAVAQGVCHSHEGGRRVHVPERRSPGRSGGDTVRAIGRIAVIGPPAAADSKIEVRDFTGNVTASGEHTTVRVSFQRKVLDGRGNVVEVNPIEDLVFYRDFFSRMDKSVYLQKERL